MNHSEVSAAGTAKSVISQTGSGETVWITTAEARAIARVCKKTILDWAAAGRFKSWRAIPSGTSRRMIDRASFLAFLGLAGGDGK